MEELFQVVLEWRTGQQELVADGVLRQNPEELQSYNNRIQFNLGEDLYLNRPSCCWPGQHIKAQVLCLLHCIYDKRHEG